MNQVPHITITQKHWHDANRAVPVYATYPDICNKAIEIALAEQANAEKEQYITAEEARKLGAGKAEYRYRGALTGWKWQDWITCQGAYESSTTTWEVQYRAIKQEPVQPTCQVRNLDTGELKTMTREAAKLLQAETMDACDWFNVAGNEAGNLAFEFNAVGIYTYKPKANLVKLTINGEQPKMVTQAVAVAIWKQLKPTHDCYYKSNSFQGEELFYDENIGKYEHDWNTHDICDCSFELRAKPLKQVSWKDVPDLVKVQHIKTKKIFTFLGEDEGDYLRVYAKDSNELSFRATMLELAPASEQPWIAMQDGQDFHDLARKFLADGFSYSFHANRFKITGLAEGYELK